MALAGVSTLGITFGYGVETTTGEKPASFTLLNRINSIGGITVDPETIDASALEDFVERTVAGRATTGGSFSVSVNFTPETNEEWKALIAAYKVAQADGKRMWFQTIVPGFTESFFVVAQPPQAIPQPEMGQNELLVVEFPLSIEDYVGMAEKVAFTA